MKAITEKGMRLLFSVVAVIVFLSLDNSFAMAADSGKDLYSLNVGVSSVVDSDYEEKSQGYPITQLEKGLSWSAGVAVDNVSLNTAKLVQSEQPEEAEPSQERILIMANVVQSVNVRLEPFTDAEKVGKLYKDCGGELLEQKDGWTKLESGDVTGWINDQYLLFGDEALALAEQVGYKIAVVSTEALRVRKEPSADAEILGLLENQSELDVIEEDNGFVLIEYHDQKGYVSEDYVKVELRVDVGETMESIRERARIEAEEKAKLKKNLGAVMATASEVDMLAAIIQCEAGNQSYEGKLAVGAVVMNRVRSGAFANTIAEVITSPGQFSPVANGKFTERLEKGANDSCRQAAEEAISGETNVGTALFFRRVGSKTGIVIGDHVFY